MRFEELNLHSSLLKAVKDQNYTKPTAIQKKAIPLVLNRNDVLGSAQTGTGKTAAFALPILHHLISEGTNKKIRALRKKAVDILYLEDKKVELKSQ